MTFDAVSRIAMALGGVTEHVKKTEVDLRREGRHLARLRSKGTLIAIRLPWNLIDELIEQDPDRFFVTEHYQGSPYVVTRLASLDEPVARRLLRESWEIAPIDLPPRP